MKPRAGQGYATVAEQLHYDEIRRSYTDVEEQNSYADNLKGGVLATKATWKMLRNTRRGKPNYKNEANTGAELKRCLES